MNTVLANIAGYAMLLLQVVSWPLAMFVWAKKYKSIENKKAIVYILPRAIIALFLQYQLIELVAMNMIGDKYNTEVAYAVVIINIMPLVIVLILSRNNDKRLGNR